MSLILLISSQKSLGETCAALLPVAIPFLSLATVTEAKSYLNHRADDIPEPALILLDAGGDQEVVAECRQLYRDCLTHEPPLIALISDPVDRQRVLDAGADDYLLQPLLPSEVYSWLANYLFAAFRDFQPVLETVQRMGRSAVSRTLSRGLENLAQIFNAPSAWLLLLNPDEKTFNLAGYYNVPPLFCLESALSHADLSECLKIVRQDDTPQPIACPYLARADRRETNGLTHHLSLPLYHHRQFIGVLNLAYALPPKISPADKHVLSLLSREIGGLLKMVQQQEETQFYATRTAFMVLIARTIGEQPDLNTALSLTLEQTVSLLDALGGDIWLLSADGQWLEAASSLSSPLSSLRASRQPLRRAKGRGLLGWVADRDRPLYTEAPVDDPRFDRQVDQIENPAGCALLAVPLRHRESVIGVMVVYYNRQASLANRDVMLLEGIAGLIASAIANARLMQELRDYAGRQQVLYEMSQQIAAGLDLPATLNRVLHWIGRLFEVEVSFLWLVKENSETVYLAAALGVDLPQTRQFDLTMGQDLTGWVARSGEAVIVNDPAGDPRLDNSFYDALSIALRNIMSVPMIYHDQTIGVLSLVNKIGGPFDEADMTQLCAIVEIVSVAISNAVLHTRTVALLNEREYLHRQILQSERLATMGRLTATLSHEINNPMQAIQGALVLALEELDSPHDVAAYLQLCQTESARVVQLLNRMRQVYHPQGNHLTSIDLNQPLQEAIALARKELKRQKVTLQTDLAPDLPYLTAVAEQLHLVFLSLLLNLADVMGAVGGGKLLARSYALPGVVRVEFSTDVLPALDRWAAGFTGANSDPDGLLNFGLFISQDVIAAHNGLIEAQRQAQRIIFRIELPLDH